MAPNSRTSQNISIGLSVSVSSRLLILIHLTDLPEFVCLSGNYWSLKLIEYVSELPSYIVLTNTAAAIKAYERCTQMQNICDIYAWNEWVTNYFPVPLGLPPGW